MLGFHGLFLIGLDMKNRNLVLLRDDGLQGICRLVPDVLENEQWSVEGWENHLELVAVESD